MSSPEEHNTHGRVRPAGRADFVGDELDRLLAAGVRELAGSGEPPARVWQQIASTLNAGPAPRRERRPRPGWQTGSLAQALAMISLLVVLGLSLGPVLQWPSFLYGSEEQLQIPTYTPELLPIVDEANKSAPVVADEGLLSQRELREWAQEQARERQVIAHDTSPAVDPILKYRHEWRTSD